MKILFICKFNRFRSKIALIFFNKLNKNPKHKAKSVGIIKGNYPLDKYEVKAAKKVGISLKGKPQGLSTNLLKWKDLIVIVADDVPSIILKDNKKYSKNLKVWKIPDVKNNTEKEIQKVIKQIEDKISKFVENLK